MVFDLTFVLIYTSLQEYHIKEKEPEQEYKNNGTTKERKLENKKKRTKNKNKRSKKQKRFDSPPPMRSFFTFATWRRSRSL